MSLLAFDEFVDEATMPTEFKDFMKAGDAAPRLQTGPHVDGNQGTDMRATYMRFHRESVRNVKASDEGKASLSDTMIARLKNGKDKKEVWGVNKSVDMLGSHVKNKKHDYKLSYIQIITYVFMRLYIRFV